MIPSGRPTSDGDDHGGQGQFDGGRQVVAQIVDDGAPRTDRLAQIALQQPPHIVHILDGGGLVQPHLPAIRFDLLIACVRSQRSSGGVHRHNLGQKKSDNGDTEHNEEQSAKAA